MRLFSLVLGALLPLSALSASVLQLNSNELADKPVTIQSSWEWHDCGKQTLFKAKSKAP